MTAETRPTVLLVDDDPWALAALKQALAGDEYRIVATTDSLRALPLIEWEGVDVLISDLDMPGVDGVELLARVRELFPRVARILVTGKGSLEQVAKAINTGEVFRFLTKPVDETELREAVREAAVRLEGLRRVVVAERSAARRAKALASLEERHPGIGTATRTSGAYLISEERIAEIAERVKGSTLETLLEPVPDLATPASAAAVLQSVEAEMAGLRAEYRRTLPDRLVELARAYESARREPEAANLMRDVKTRAHALRGTAGTYGLPDVGEAAGRIEDAVERGRLNGWDDGVWAEVDEALNAAFAGVRGVARGR